MTISDEDVIAYVDGEMDEAGRTAMTFAALGDPDLADRIAAHRALRDRLATHFAPITAEPVPDAWIAQVRAATSSPDLPQPAPVIDLSAARAARQARPRPRALWFGPALAASLAIGLFAGSHWLAPSPGPIAARDGALIATGALASALDTQLASAPPSDINQPRVLASFRRDDGKLCRVFTGTQASGVACRNGPDWTLAHVLPGSPAATTAYRQAGSPDATLMAIAQDMTSQAPLDATQERAARDGGWK